MHAFANPKRFLGLARWLTPALLGLGGVLTLGALAGAGSPCRPTG